MNKNTQQDMDKAQFILIKPLTNILEDLGDYHPAGYCAGELLMYLKKSPTNMSLIKYDIQNGFFLYTEELSAYIRELFSAVPQPEFNTSMEDEGFITKNDSLTPNKAEKAKQDLDTAYFNLIKSLKELTAYYPDGDCAGELLMYLAKSPTNMSLIKYDRQNGFFLCTKDLPEYIHDRFLAVLRPEFNKGMEGEGFIAKNGFFTR